MNGKHVGTTLYQRDATCKRRLTFYACAFINAETPNNAMNNPTMASQAMIGGLGSGLDSCTVEIENTEPSYCIPADVCSPTMPPWAPGQASADNLAWQLFIALNWPADAEQPGYPNTPRRSSARPTQAASATLRLCGSTTQPRPLSSACPPRAKGRP